MELKRDNVALLDKICVYNFQISKVENYDYLLEAGIIIVKEKQKNYIEIAGPGQYISSIRIKKTKYFDSFLYEVGKDDQYPLPRILTCLKLPSSFKGTEA